MSVLLRDGTLITGTGRPRFRGSILVEGGRITQVIEGDADPVSADCEVPLDGAVACPGFVDAHSHGDLKAITEPTLRPLVKQGITTLVVGQDGFSMGPFGDAESRRHWGTYLYGLTDEPSSVLSWSSLDGYLEAIDRSSSATNVATLVGHSTVRYEVMGMSGDDPNAEQLQQMRELISDAVDAGAVGFSTGLEYAPACHSRTDELIELSSPLADTNRPMVAHVRNYGEKLVEALDELAHCGERHDIPVHVSHLKPGGPWIGRSDKILSHIQSLRERGVSMTADVYPYRPGATMLSAFLPPRLLTGTVASFFDRLERKSVRRTLRENDLEGVDWDSLVVSNVRTEHNRTALGRSIADVAGKREVSPVDAVCDLLVEERLGVCVIARTLDERATIDIKNVLAAEGVVVGTDGLFGEHPHPRLYGTIGRVLNTYAGDSDTMSLERTVHKLSTLPARLHGFRDRAVLEEGTPADITVLRPEKVAAPASFESPRQFTRGIEHVLVNGEFVVRDREITGATPGEAIRV